MANFKYAIRAFYTILIGRDHIYSDNYMTTLRGNRSTIERLRHNITDQFNDAANQEKVLIEAEKILKGI